MDLIRSYNKADISRLRKLCDHPAVREKLLTGMGDVSMTARLKGIVQAPGVYCLGHDPEKLMVVLFPVTPDVFHLHVVVHPDFRGREAVHVCRECARLVFEKTSCRVMIGMVPERDRQLKMMASMVGMRRAGVVKGYVIFQGTKEMLEGR